MIDHELIWQIKETSKVNRRGEVSQSLLELAGIYDFFAFLTLYSYPFAVIFTNIDALSLFKYAVQC